MAVPPTCVAFLDRWCNVNCPLSGQYGSLLARYDYSNSHTVQAWRCYARTALSADGSKYVGGTAYCTRHEQLLKQLMLCVEQQEDAPASSEEVTIDPKTGAAATANAKQQQRQQQQQELQRRQLEEQQKRQQQQEKQQQEKQQEHLRQRQQQLEMQQRRQQLDQSTGDPWWRGRAPAFRRTLNEATVPRYQHDASFRRLAPGLRLPRLDDCEPEIVASAQFWAASLYTSSYAFKAERLKASCKAFGVCCAASFVPDGAYEGLHEGDFELRHYLIATKPLFMLEAWRSSHLPLAWLDVDLEFHAFPTLFTPRGWDDVHLRTGGVPRDVLLWNWQANVTMFDGRRLKTASGVAWFNKTDAAEHLLVAWSEAMAYTDNIKAPDDQALDLLVNDDGWIDRCSFGWLPESYLRMMPRHKHIEPVIDHDRGAPVSGRGKNSPVKPVLPPRLEM